MRYSVPEAARALGISERAVRKRIDAGTLLATKDGRSWTVFLDLPAGGTGTAASAVLAEPTEPHAVPDAEPVPDRAVPRGTGTAAVDLAPLVALVDRLTRENASLTQAATLWQTRAAHLEEQLKQLTAGGPLEGSNDRGAGESPASEPHEASPTARTATEAAAIAADTLHRESHVAGWLRKLLRR